MTEAERKLIDLLVALAAPAEADEARGWAEKLVALSRSLGTIEAMERVIAAGGRAGIGAAPRLH